MAKKVLNKNELEEVFEGCYLVYGVKREENGFHFHRAIDGEFSPKELVRIAAIMSNEIINFCLENFAEKESEDFKDLSNLKNILEVLFYKEFVKRRENDSFF